MHLTADVPAGGEVSWLLRLDQQPPSGPDRFADAGDVLTTRRKEADAFYASITPPSLDDDQSAVEAEVASEADEAAGTEKAET